MLFGRSNADAAATSKVNAVKFEEEGWEVVKPTKGNPQQQLAKVSQPDISTESSEKSDCKVSNDDAPDAANNPVDSAAPFVVIPSEKKSSGISIESFVDAIPDIHVQEWLASIDFTQLADQGTKSYYLVKRNLKAVALLFLVGVFCVNRVPAGQRFKRETVPSSPPDMPNGAPMVEYDLLVEQLRAKIEQMEATGRQVAHELSMAVFERNHWRTMALGCDHDLREVSSAHAKLEEQIKQSKLMAPLAFVAPSSPRPNATAIADTPYVDQRLPTPEPSPPKRIPYPQLALPEPQPVPLLPKPSMKTGRGSRARGQSALILAPSVAVTAV